MSYSTYLHFWDCLTAIFPISESDNPPICVSELHKTIWWTDFETLEICDMFGQVESFPMFLSGQLSLVFLGKRDATPIIQWISHFASSQK